MVPMYGVVVPALAAAEGFIRPMVVFGTATPPPAVRPVFTVGVIVVLSIVPIVEGMSTVRGSAFVCLLALLVACLSPPPSLPSPTKR